MRSRLSEPSTASRIVPGVMGNPPRTAFEPSPTILVAMTSSSRRPVLAIQLPMISSVRPEVSAEIGLTG